MGFTLDITKRSPRNKNESYVERGRGTFEDYAAAEASAKTLLQENIDVLEVSVVDDGVPVMEKE